MSALDPHTIASKIVNAVEALDELGAAPSHATQIRAAALIGSGGLILDLRQAVVCTVVSGISSYDVVMVLAPASATEIVSARCPCPAEVSCKHLTAALAVAQTTGYVLALQPGA